MQGPGYLISEFGKLYCDNIFDYDSWEYFTGELKGMDRLLKGVSSLIKDEISIDIFLNAYEKFKNDNNQPKLHYTDEGLLKAGLNKEDIEKLNGE